VQKNISELLKAKMEAADQKMNEVQGYEANSISNYVNTLLQQGKVEVGYRAQCGATHSTQKVFRQFLKIVKLLQAEGFKVYQENVTHKNAYATNNGGFWNSIVFNLHQS
jgi:hypothetical protein